MQYWRPLKATVCAAEANSNGPQPLDYETTEVEIVSFKLYEMLPEHGEICEIIRRKSVGMKLNVFCNELHIWWETPTSDPESGKRVWKKRGWKTRFPVEITGLITDAIDSGWVEMADKSGQRRIKRVYVKLSTLELDIDINDNNDIFPSIDSVHDIRERWVMPVPTAGGTRG